MLNSDIISADTYITTPTTYLIRSIPEYIIGNGVIEND